jgi:hypothetical protein
MRDALLLNPFYAHAEPKAAPRTRGATRSTPICSHCNSDDIVAQATVQWSNEAQEWQLANTFDQPAYCNSCHRACDISWIALS